MSASLTNWRIAIVFGAFAFNYFLSALLRAVVATLAPEFARELQLGAGDLGLLAGAYFLGFACMQLPLGPALDRYGARRALVTLLVFAVVGCLGFALARSFQQLVLARLLIGVGVSASLMAPLAAFARLLPAPLQLRLNSWMLMSGSLGMVASTLPVQALLPWLGWRGLFVAIAAALLVGMLGIALLTRADQGTGARLEFDGSYGVIVRHPVFVRSLPLAFFTYGGLVGVQALWAGPWLTQVAAMDSAAAAQGLFLINLSMLVSFLCWGIVMPRLVQRGVSPARLIAWGWPAGAAVLVAVIAIGADAGPTWLSVWCVCTSVVTLCQPVVAQAFPKESAGRALTAFNLAIFLGVFACQWGMGLTIDALMASGWDRPASHRAAMALLLSGMVAAGLWYWIHPRRGAHEAVIAARG